MNRIMHRNRCKLNSFFSILHGYIHRHSGLEFHGGFVLINKDFFNWPPDKLFVVFGNGGGLIVQECAHIGYPFSHLIAACIFHLRLLFLLTQMVDFLGDASSLVGLGADQLQKLRLQFS